MKIFLGLITGLVFSIATLLPVQPSLTAWGDAGYAGSETYQSKLNKIVLGYYTEDVPGDILSYNSLSENGELIDYIATFSYATDEKGNLSGQPISKGIELAKKENVRPLMLVHNFTEFFDDKLAHKVLSVQENRKNLEKNILKLIRENGYEGVNIDIEAVPPADRNYYTVFLSELKKMFEPYGYLLTVSIPAKTWDTPQSAWSGAYDYRAIGRQADIVVIMTYDEHWSGGKPGPIASFPWVQSVLDYATWCIPRHKLLMGVAAYGYDWSAAGTKSVDWNNVDPLIRRYGARWDDYLCTPHLEYWDGSGVSHEVWFENKYSLGLKLDLANAYGVAGIAIWRLGREDASFWETVQRKFQKSGVE